jgi:putative transcriptional regulator
MISFVETRLFTRLVQEYLKMANQRRDIGAEILAGLRELKHGEVGRVVNVPDVAQTRQKTGLTQARFSQLLGVSVRTLQDWEQGRRAPSGAARTLLAIAAKNPQALLEVA